MDTILLRDGLIVDGSGLPAFPGHVLIDGGRIAAIVPAGGGVPAADRVIPAAGCVICPGFIDVHSHADWHLTTADQEFPLAGLLEQGITTVVAGNCGFSPAPVRPGHRDLVNRAVAAVITGGALDFRWESFAGFLDVAARIRPAVNLLPLVGHAALRLHASGRRSGRLTKKELEDALRLLRQSFDGGARGLSLGLGYEPGMYAGSDEIDAFCRVAADRGLPVAVHLKALSHIAPTYPLTARSPHNLLALREMLDTARRTGIRLQLSHFLFAGRRSRASVDAALETVHRVRWEDTDVLIDAFPYTAGNTTIHAVWPFWFLRLPPRRRRGPLIRALLRIEMEVGLRLVGFRYGDFQIMDAALPGRKDLAGLRIDEVARRWKVGSFAALLRISEESGGAALMLYHAYGGEPDGERALETVLADPLCLYETDALFREEGYPNPAGRGAFPRILGRYVREKKLCSLENAIRRMTGAGAERFGIGDRGVLHEGKAADIVVFDRERIAEGGTNDPQRVERPCGIHHVFLNGVEAVRDGVRTGSPRSGQVLG